MRKPNDRPLRRILALLLRGLGLLPTMLAGLLSHLALLINWLRLRYVEYVPRPTDIFLVTYPRSGTTWLQMMLYQLTTDGDMNIPHIAQCIPWFERLGQTGKNVEALPAPRIFKTHLFWRHLWWTIPRGAGRYIYLVRDGRDVAVSYYHFYKSHLHFHGDFSAFFDLFLRGRVQYGSWFKHVAGWATQKHQPNVLWLRYEDLLADLEGNLRRIADFCGLTIAPERWPGILERCSFAFMKQHEIKFDHAVELLWENGMMPGSFLRKGQKMAWKDLLTPAQQAAFEKKYKKHADHFTLQPA
ncbi:MAG: sulfotransferase domain-containing protein [candidate division KSB1 bacterium]|nr:sulfotransferase domain-containing protein [candidate division KSB1 bacterium]MDZ7273652.1 sulfotransferase domain-containing protein [candidate division KSB1 bacterium]MDZ7286757.1 sulfotransferase domain-containing protein [candidate division KSB1 bacterium]MDZ7299886.1 sulfotransferase domain-containing protein [candidate division KSB1 bacterium]MDZ7308821.1 sulfotransferase domain-containing protein [candidate division KSB1 bacterium]